MNAVNKIAGGINDRIEFAKSNLSVQSEKADTNSQKPLYIGVSDC